MFPLIVGSAFFLLFPVIVEPQTIFQSPQRRVQDAPAVRAGSPHFLATILLYRNGGAQMNEWLDHYVDEGVNLFIFINDGSTDGYHPPTQYRGRPIIYTTTSSILAKLVANEANRTDDTRITQREALLEGLDLLANKAEWVLIVDQDEFVTTKRAVESTVANELRTTFAASDAVLFPWVLMSFKPTQDSSL